MPKFCGTTACDQCPWRKDVEPGRFPPERFESLRTTFDGEDWFKPIFACHKAPCGEEFACVGYLIVAGWSNLNVRMAAARGAFNPKDLSSPGPLFDSAEEMMEVNGMTRHSKRRVRAARQRLKQVKRKGRKG